MEVIMSFHHGTLHHCFLWAMHVPPVTKLAKKPSDLFVEHMWSPPSSEVSRAQIFTHSSTVTNKTNIHCGV